MITAALDPGQFAALRHIAVAPSGLNYFSGALEAMLAAQGLSRRISITSPHFLLAAYLAANSDLVLAIPSRAAQRLAAMLPLMLFEIPLELADIQIAMYWHERTHKSEAHGWFRETVRKSLPRSSGRAQAPPDIVTVDASEPGAESAEN